MATVVRNRVYLFFALALLAVMLGGFARTFYLHYWFDVAPITRLLIAHGVVFTAWFVLFVVQTRLIAAQNYRLHMRVGIAGAVLAVLVVLLGFATIVMSVHVPRPRPMGFTAAQFTFFPFSIIVMFGALVAAAIAWRRKAQIHKRLMMLAMIVVIGPAVARIINITGGGAHFLALQTAATALFVIACLLFDRLKYGVVHPVYAIGGPLLVLAWPMRAWVAGMPAWERVGQWLGSLAS